MRRPSEGADDWDALRDSIIGLGDRSIQKSYYPELQLRVAELERMVHDVAETMGRVVEMRDPYTQGHQKRVAHLAAMISREMGMSESDTECVEMAGLLHDIGKLRVPSEILTKSGELSAPERNLIREHPAEGYEILRHIAFPCPIADVVLQHHERMDGSGYPSGLSGDDISMGARILMVADVVEAMSAYRPYRAALGLDAAMAEITEHPEKYDPQVVLACVRLHEAGRIEV